MTLIAPLLTALVASGASYSSPSAVVPTPEASVSAQTPEVQWTRHGGEPLQEVAGYRVTDYRDAGDGGLDWTLIGEGQAGGNGTRHLFMIEGPLAARTELRVESEAVAFMMDGDGNEGFATFLVDGQEVGTFDMYHRSMQTLVVTGLPLAQHTLEVRTTGRQRRGSHGAHVSMYGGSALVRDVIARR